VKGYAEGSMKGILAPIGLQHSMRGADPAY
jgi:hypothetical protein